MNSRRPVNSDVGHLHSWLITWNFHLNSNPKSKLDLNGRKNHLQDASPKIVRRFIFAGVLDTTVIFRPMATSSWKPTTFQTMNLRSPIVADRRRSHVWCSGQNTCPLSRSCFLIVRQTLRRATRAKAPVGCTAVFLGRRVFYVMTVPAWGGLRYRNVCVTSTTPNKSLDRSADSLLLSLLV